MSMRVLTEITIRLRCGAICVIRPVNPIYLFITEPSLCGSNTED